MPSFLQSCPGLSEAVGNGHVKVCRGINLEFGSVLYGSQLLEV